MPRPPLPSSSFPPTSPVSTNTEAAGCSCCCWWYYCCCSVVVAAAMLRRRATERRRERGREKERVISGPINSHCEASVTQAAFPPSSQEPPSHTPKPLSTEGDMAVCVDGRMLLLLLPLRLLTLTRSRDRRSACAVRTIRSLPVLS